MIVIRGKKYSVADNVILEDKAIPLTWWTVTPNFGDLLSPYLISKLTSLPVKPVPLRIASKQRSGLSAFRKPEFSYFAIGSIIRRTNSRSIVWGSGSFGTERKKDINPNTSFLAVRGPLTRNLIRIYGNECPEIYGDPALILPEVFYPKVARKYKIGVILRWSEAEWDNTEFDSDIKKINMRSSDIEGTLKEMLSCERIISSSLHGVVLADAYGIPSAWLGSSSPKGLEFKFYDYFLSVNKIQKPQKINFSGKVINYRDLDNQIRFNDHNIEFDPTKLLEACPFIQPA
jgi:pyruvyltransferase